MRDLFYFVIPISRKILLGTLIILWIVISNGPVAVAQDVPWPLPSGLSETPSGNASGKDTNLSTAKDNITSETAPVEYERQEKIISTPAEVIHSIPAEGQDGLISNVFYESDLRQAIQDLATAAQQTVLVGPSVQGVVNADIKDKTLDEALDILLAGSGYLVQKTPDYRLVYSPDPDSPGFRELSTTKLYQLDYLDATDAANLLSATLQQFVKPRPKSNEIAITAPPQIMEQVVASLDQVDKRPNQFLLESRIVVLEDNDLLDLGVNWSWPSVRAGAYSNDSQHGSNAAGAAWPWSVEVGYTPGGDFTNGLIAQLNALVTEERANIIATPRLMAQNGEEATIQVTTEEYFEILTQGFYTSSQLEKIESGTTLKIIPSMGEDGRITLKIEAEVSDVVARGENDLPVVSRRITKNSVWVEDGGTATIAGLTDTRLREVKQRVPFISRIPLLGRLFTNKAKDDSKREVAIFITARKLDDNALSVPIETSANYREPFKMDHEFFEQVRSQMNLPAN